MPVLLVLVGLIAVGWLLALLLPGPGPATMLRAPRARWALYPSARVALLVSPLFGAAMVAARWLSDSSAGSDAATLALFTFVVGTLWWAGIGAAEVALCRWWAKHRDPEPPARDTSSEVWSEAEHA